MSWATTTPYRCSNGIAAKIAAATKLISEMRQMPVCVTNCITPKLAVTTAAMIVVMLMTLRLRAIRSA